MRDTTFRTRLFLCFLAIIVVTMVLPGLYIRQSIQENGISDTIHAARREAHLIRMMLQYSSIQKSEELSPLLHSLGTALDIRITYIAMNGKVLAESDITPTEMKDLDNHADRMEIISALAKGTGVSVRYSETLQTHLVYVAIPFEAIRSLPSGILRVAVPLERVEQMISTAEYRWFGILALATILALFSAIGLSLRLERSLKEMIRVVESIAADPTQEEGRRRLHILPGKEFRRLAHSVNNMADRIEEDLHTIAEHKAQLETILDSMDEGVLVIGAQGRIRLVNPALIKLFPQAAGAEGKMPVEVIPIAELQQALDTLLTPSCTYPFLSTLEVEPRPEMVLSVHVIRPRETVHGVLAVAVFHDISEMARLMRVRKEFVANVSHELRTPLTAIIGYAETLQDTPPEDVDGGKRFAETILRNARHMADMVEDLLKLSRIESGAVPMEFAPVHVSKILSDVITACQPIATEHRLTLDVVVDTSIIIRADAHFITQVFRNLIENACRYAPEGSTVLISGEIPVPKENAGMALFSVRDEGPGIPEKDLQRIFERFYRVEKHRSSPASTGLGLAICKHIIERHGGLIWAESGPGGLFKCTIPRVEASDLASIHCAQ